MAIYVDANKNITECPDFSMYNIHIHEHYEIYCFLSGDARYYVEGNIYELSPDDILFINKAEAHSLLMNGKSPYVRIPVHFNSEALLGDTKKFFEILALKPLGAFNRIHGTPEEKEKWIYYINNIASGDCNTKRVYLTVLVNELLKKLEKRLQKPSEYSSDDIIEYINENLSEIQSLDDLCEKFYMSKTHLNRRFKAMTGSSVWDYITIKRLLKAKEMLSRGFNPTEVCSKLGYRDYTTFYRAYRQKFNVSPKKDYTKK